ncbi:MAG: hypothetical protein AAGI30_05705, partial [Planctomycetota bacterium]
DGVQPTTAAPRIIAHTNERCAEAPLEDGDMLVAPAVVQMHCPTPGASIEWNDPDAHTDRWHLYTAPFVIRTPGPRTLRARAVRLGFKPSRTASVSFDLRRA